MAKKEVTKKSKGKSSKKSRDIEIEIIETKSKKKKSKAEAASDKTFNPYASYNDVLDTVAKKLSDADTLDDMAPMSTGSLVLDYIEGGGIRPAWYTHFGPEQSAKTTGALLIMASAIKNNVPIISLRDFEGSSGNSIPYVRSILKTSGIKLSKEELFGKKDDKTGKWIIAPRVRYSSSTKGVSFFNWFASVLRRLADKKVLNGEWWLVYEDEKENAHLKEHADMTMPKKYGKGIYIKAPDGGLQGVVIVDSYPNMNPDYKDEDQSDNSLALQARMFSKNLPRVKGYLASKKVAVIGINQLRDVPMAMFGPKEAEPCGKAVRYNSDCRLRFYPRALSAIKLWPKEDKIKKGYEVERSIDGGKDYYKYISIKAAKNKLSESDREGFIRLWTKDSKGEAHGIDPVYDTLHFLKASGQLKGKGRSALTLFWGHEHTTKTLTWDDFKLWILGSKEDMMKISKKAGLPKPMDLRKACFKQMASGKAELMFSAAGKSTADEEEDDE
jgi:RecA/RadA recombinase